MQSDCGGCRGEGSHRRWCPVAVGRSAAHYGRMAQQAENLADTVGANHTGAANHLYVASSLLREKALEAKKRFQEQGQAD